MNDQKTPSAEQATKERGTAINATKESIQLHVLAAVSADAEHPPHVRRGDASEHTVRGSEAPSGVDFTLSGEVEHAGRYGSSWKYGTNDRVLQGRAAG